MQKLLKYVVVAALLCLTIGAVQAATITSVPPAPPNTVYDSLSVPYPILESPYTLDYGVGAAMSGPNPWNHLSEIEITLALFNARTDPGQANEGVLELYLDGIATGLLLDGFGEGVQEEHTITLNPGDPFAANYAAIIAALNADGELIPTIVHNGATELADSLSGRFPTANGGNVVVSLSGDFDIPEPGTYVLIGTGLLAFGFLRRFRVKKA